MKPQKESEQSERPEDPEARREMDARAAELAMQSDHQAFAGSADGVGSVEFDDPGAFGVSPKVEAPAEDAPDRPPVQPSAPAMPNIAKP